MAMAGFSSSRQLPRMRDPDGDGIIATVPISAIGSEFVSIIGTDLVIYPTSNKQAGEYTLIITLTDDNVRPLSQNYTMSLIVTSNPNLIEEGIIVQPESSKTRELTLSLRSMHSDGRVVFTLSETLNAENYEMLIWNLTNSLTVNVSSRTHNESMFRWEITKYDYKRRLEMKLSFKSPNSVV